MKCGFKGIAALLLCLILTDTALGALPVTASAAEVTQTSSYVLQYAPDTLTEPYDYQQPYLYTTPFMVDHTITGENGDLRYSGDDFPEIFNLINTTKLADGGEGTYASIGAYRIDAAGGIREDTSYRRINLEDAAYYDSETAGKIRAVVRNSFPQKDAEAIQTTANVWLRRQGMEEITELQSGEAILAAQITIWKLANADHYIINTYCSGRKNFFTPGWSGYLADVADAGTAEQLCTDHTLQNVESLFQYLYHLDAAEPMHDAVSESTLKNPVYSAVKERDGSYTISLTVTINTMAGEGDALTLSAVCGEHVESRTITGDGEYTFRFSGLPDRMEVKLEINGWQQGGDVYLFDAEGEQRRSQSLVGYDDSRLPVHGEIVVTPDRILNINMRSSEETGGIPLANIAFNIYRVADLAKVESGALVLSEQPTQREIEKYGIADNLIATLKTDDQGFAAYNFTANGKPDGVYMIVEQFSTATTGAVEPFFLAVPGTTSDGSGFAYTLNIYPQNTAESGPDIEQDVGWIGNHRDSYDVGKLHTWIIRGSIPAGLGTAKEYSITDVLDYRLDYEKGSPIVRLFTAAGAELTLKPDDHYAIIEGTANMDGSDVDTFRICLTPAGMAYVAANKGTGENIPEIRVYFKAAINSSAAMGEQIPNQSHLDYTNSAGIDYDADSDVSEVHTGGINILKTNAGGNIGLSGATFRIARTAAEAEVKAGAAEVLSADGEERNVVFVNFHTAKDLSGEKANEVTTDEKGKAVIYGLAYGTYYIVEIRTTAGYNLLTQPIQVEIDGDSHLTAEDGWIGENGTVVDNTVQIINTKYILPDSGGMTTIFFTVTGMGIIGSACLLLIINSKKKRC